MDDVWQHIMDLEMSQTRLGQRVAELERQLRNENTHPIPGDIDLPVDAFVLKHNWKDAT